MSEQGQQKDRCVLTRHDVQSIKDLVFIVGGNSESSAQKAIFEILADNMRKGSRPIGHSSAPEQNPLAKENLTVGMVTAYEAGYEQAKREERERVLEQLNDLRRYSSDEYEEAYLSDNEREMRIHVEYGNRIWGIMKTLRGERE